MLVDSHCHLQDKKFAGELDAVVLRAHDAGVTAMVCIGYDMESSRGAVDIANAHENIYAAIGVHPHDAKTLRSKDIDDLAKMADSAKVVAIGEIGLDYYRDLSPRDVQERAFRDQLELARGLSVPVVIHSRDADEETYAIIADYERQALRDWPKDRPLGIMHCFAGDLPLALRYIELGFVISIPAACTYPNSERTRAVAGGIPLRWMAVETDAPYIPPQNRRGQRNEPAYICETVQCIADIRGARYEEIADGTAMAAAWLFGLGDIGEAATTSALGDVR
ncbi:MAG TPA: TatD family hydrolase [Dehalococcoidia bacterium]|nr:TatD family hydrolase [Dehalococcoidia bacterium]